MFGKDEAQAFLANAFAPWVQALDLTVEEITPEGRAVLSMPITDSMSVCVMGIGSPN